jgi:hypothetical protein
MISATPVKMAQKAMTYSSASDVIPGQMKATRPANIPKIPEMMSQARDPAPCWNAEKIEKIPSTIAYAPKKTTSTSSVMPGQISARIPKMIAAMPRTSTTHQVRASFSIPDCCPRRAPAQLPAQSKLHDYA